MNKLKYKKLCRSKYRFPTRLVSNVLQIGHKLARADIERELGCSIEYLPKSHTPYEWRWCVPIGMSVAEANEYYKHKKTERKPS